MKKIAFFAVLVCTFSINTNAQLMATKLVGKGSEKYGMGYGLFTFLDFPLASENNSIRIELAEFAFYPGKGESFFTSTGDGKGYLSIKAGYKHVFSETQTGFYLEPSVGYCRVVNVNAGEEATYGDGVAGALEAGYSLGVGQRGHTINLGVKYETDHAGTGHTINSLGLRVSYAFNMFRKKEY